MCSSDLEECEGIAAREFREPPATAGVVGELEIGEPGRDYGHQTAQRRLSGSGCQARAPHIGQREGNRLTTVIPYAHPQQR